MTLQKQAVELRERELLWKFKTGRHLVQALLLHTRFPPEVICETKTCFSNAAAQESVGRLCCVGKSVHEFRSDRKEPVCAGDSKLFYMSSKTKMVLVLC